MRNIKKTFYDWCVENNKEDLLDRWDYDLNKVSPKEVGYLSNKNFYFNCDKNKNHNPEYVRLSHVSNGNINIKCKECNSFAQWCSDNLSEDFIDKYWVKELNVDINPKRIGRGSHKKIFLKCNNGLDHLYSVQPNNFIRGECDCLVCNGKTILKGFNDLFTTNPELIKIWNFDKNININPYELSYGSGKKVWWKCEVCGHEWEALISNIVAGKRCPICAVANRSNLIIDGLLQKKFSIADQFPKLLSIWDYQKNNNIDPFNIFPSSRQQVYWKCENGHSFKQSITSMCKNALNEESLCKYCDGIGVHLGENDIFSTHPQLLVDWDYNKNINVSPTTIAFGSTKKVWWKCSYCGYEWQASPNARTNNLSGCPECARHFNRSKLQAMVEEYIISKYGFNILHERDCTIIATNPKTGYKLPYDNDVDINGTRLIIEVHGEQHYKITEFSKTNAEKNGTTPEYELSYQQYKDKIKKEYAIANKYEYLEIPYYAIKKDMYKTIIDSKINEILSCTIQN